MPSVLALLTTLLLLQESSSEIAIEISQPHGQRILNFAEIQLVQGGQTLPDYLTTLSFSASTEQHNDVRFCNDANELTYCQNILVFHEGSGQWEGAEERPSLYIRLEEAFFEELVSQLLNMLLPRSPVCSHCRPCHLTFPSRSSPSRPAESTCWWGPSLCCTTTTAPRST